MAEKERDNDGSLEKVERLAQSGVRLRKGIAMGGMENPGVVSHGKSAKMPTTKQTGKGNKSAY